MNKLADPIRIFLLRWLKRFLVLSIGVVLSLFISWQLFPAIDGRTPLILSLFLTYVISAYILMPIAIRLARTLIKPTHVPHYTVTPDGFANDPVNISFVGTKHQIIRAMGKAGWHTADDKNPKTIIKTIKAYVLHQHYPTQPFSNMYLFGRSQDLGFQKKVGESVTRRHHFRLWACTNKADPAFRGHVRFWQRKHRLEKNQKLLWVGSAIQDEGLGLIRYTGQLTHGVLPDTDAERDMIVEDLKKASVLKEVKTIDAGDPTIRDNRVIGDEMIADGDLKLCILV